MNKPWLRHYARGSEILTSRLLRSLHLCGFRTLFILLALPLLWSRGGLARAQETNLAKNPGFEEPAKPNGLPGGGWWLYQGRGEAVARVDRGVAHTGQASVELHADAPAKATLVSAPFPVAPGDELHFAAWVRAEKPESGKEQALAGLAFRRADGTVFKNASFTAQPLGGTWALISGTAEAPQNTASAEVHLGYTNAPDTLWYDDIVAVITSPVSLSLVEPAQPWPGRQDIALLLTSRQTALFQGTIRAVVSRQQQTIPVTLAPGTTRQVEIPITLNGVGPHRYAISLLDATGATVRVLKGRFHTRPSLVLYPACPCYHAVGEGDGETRIDARVNLNPAQRAGLRFAVTVKDAAGKAIRAATADASTGDYVGLEVRLPIQAPATFAIMARLLDPAGRDIAQATTDVHVIPREECRVTIGSNGFLRVAGKPQFPIGLYSTALYEEVGRAGFTATHNYAITGGDPGDPINPNDGELQRLLDLSWANHMRMMVELPRKAIEKAEWQQVRRRILTFRDHPGLLCWDSEERVARGLAPLSHIATLYHLVHQLDPDHPFVLGDSREEVRKLQNNRRNFFPDPDMDVGIWWWYPIPLKEPDGNGLGGRDRPSGLLEPPSWLTTTLSRKPLWIAIQAYQHPKLNAPFPTPAQYRCMAYLSIINGVKALWFYTGSGQRDYYGKPAGLLNKPKEAHWDYVQKLVAELRDFSPVIMAPTPAAKLTLSPADAPVEFALRELRGSLYLIAANKSVHPQSVRFSGPLLAGRRAKVLYETHSAAIEGDSLTDDFAPFAVHLYALDKP
jgi:hypothetical protein